MLHKPRLILTLLLLISAIAILYGQNEAVALADTSAVYKDAVQALDELYNNNWDASYWIEWENFTLNGEFLGDYYWDAYDDYEEDYFIDEILAEIADLLHYEGDENDAFRDFTAEYLPDKTILRAHNDKIQIEMEIEPDVKLYIINLNISNPEER